MRENYIKQVKKGLAVSRKQKKEVIRDLNEAFSSALEHGETEQQVIERLGSPKDFADNIHEQLGIDCIARQKRKKLLHITIAAVIAVMAFFVSFLIKALRVPKNVIGQADTMTSIQVEGTAIDPMIFFTLLGIVALVVVITLVVRYIRKK
ncbi:DUF1700 domain-containing protein [Ruminococcus sp.]|jgi:uncharacterized membrane protein|uniref:DUF1700 domain-containing protein n=1 Tax=Ruminococcus sp. TaxID=41978 RepID=UPI003AADE85B